MANRGSEIEKAVQKTDENQFRFVTNVLTRRWCWPLGGLLLGLAAFSAVSFLRYEETIDYYAETTLMMQRSQWELVAAATGGPASTGFAVSSSAIASDVVRALVQQDLAEGGPFGAYVTEYEYQAAADNIAAALTISYDPKSRIVTIQCKRPDKRDAERITEFAARAIVREHQESALEKERESLDFIKAQLEEVQEELERKEKGELEFRAGMGFRDRDRVSLRIAAWNLELQESQMRRDQYGARLVNIEDALVVIDEALPQALGQISDSIVKQLIEDLNALIVNELEMKIQMPDLHPDLIALRDDITYQKEKILATVQELRPGAEGGSEKWRQRELLVSEYANIQLSMVELDVRSATIKRLLRQHMDTFSELAEMDFEHQRLKRELSRLSMEFNKLLDKELELKTSLEHGKGQLKRQKSVRSWRSVSWNISRLTTTVVGSVIGLFAGLGLAVMLEMNDTSIHTIEDVAQYIGLEVIGTIPRMRFGRRGRRKDGSFVPLTDEGQFHACAVTQHDPKSPVSEAYRTLRTRFQLTTIKEKPKTMVVTSAVPGEGKTTTAVNMAVTFADSGMRVLLIDTDLRRPNVHRVLRMDRGKGLADLLQDGLEIESVTRPTGVENLLMISSGGVPPNPSELLGSDKMRRLLRDVSNDFDMVICDAPSVLVVTDPVLLSTVVDTVVLVVSVEWARRDTILHAKKLIETTNTNIAGVVLNGLSSSRRHYYYYYYYYEDGGNYRQRKWYHL